ncbi:TPA: molybdate ABC transporter substrate-binding protein [Vibrio parahaemolyticus]|uniref:molybdate ABC transporter substrate-binding protein n=1 Tax=Vibrio parahaemolyticus TaxID=670 RepID=UPI00040671D7|nr:molybdate ABC transporter substrate-binding protein [Vibrio parahaemolyticus]EGQ8246379.1 molybdate ABC transporter substrate-binding protein [Vibrio parahaemolyticus]EGQ8928179.1 molybdate ABC transporter substrate-binding protein [Vibrio parahaemolyticus]EGQ8972821.1 molybdate ABC transporter substrate-binding protein [Vibrio parahaemolyticus]EGQ8977271.1 molybdate ABC transporter substrate-binding protein [Vibrio parahaemolyticus]EGQ8996824.1 molybdate ABC transporter substrate-binding p
MKAWKTHACLAAILSISFSTNAATDLKVYAASSMTNAIDEIAQDFKEKYDVTVTPVYGGSSSIARQIINGAPADVFISANTKWMDYLVDEGVIDSDNVTNLVRNSLVLIAPQSSSLAVFNFADAKAWEAALNDSRLALGNPTSVPAGMYAKESLTTLGVWKEIQTKVAPAKNVRLALALVERGEAPLGVVYKTDAQLTSKVKIVGEFASDTHAAIVYPAAVVNDSTESRQFFQYLKSEDAKRVFAHYGFQQ